MDISSACGVSVSCSLDSGYDLKQSHTDHLRRCKTAKGAAEDGIMEKFGKALARILHVHDVKLQLSGHVSLSVGDKLSDGFNLDQPKHLNATRENFNKCVSFPCLEKEQSNLVSVEDEISEDFNVDQAKMLNATIQENTNKCVSLPCLEKEQSNLVSVEDKISEDFNVDQPKMLNATIQENTNKCVSLPCPEKEPSNLVSVDENEKDEVADISLHTKSQINSENLPCEHPTSDHAAKKLVSAMKGSREALGMPLKKLSVTWAPDVYDPPVTSLYQTRRSHNQQRSRSKKSSKHRHKGKSSQGSSTSKHHHQKHVGRSDFQSKSSLAMGAPNLRVHDYSTLEIRPLGAYDYSTLEGSTFGCS